MSGTQILKDLETIVGSSQLKTHSAQTAYYRSGFRSGRGEALAVVFPQTLLQLWEILKVCVAADCAIIMQAAKTGLTEGSSPSGSDYDRPVVIINPMRIKKITLLDDGKQVLALPGSTLHELENKLAPIQRVPHSVIGSTTIGASIIGGIANNAGGALCKRGSSYTELALFARVNENGELELVNHLGIEGLGDSPEEILTALEAGNFHPDQIQGWDKVASDRDYGDRIRQMDAPSPNRYNADPARLFELSGSAGKVVAFAARVDTYPAPKEKQVFFLGTNDHQHLVTLRKKILSDFAELPDMGEYMDRNIFDTAHRYGKDVFLSIKHLGTARLPKAYALKSKVEYWLNKVSFLPKFLPDLFLYYLSQLFPGHLPKRLLEFRDRFEYYLILSTTDD
ncbi:MAG: D-lactate dehydrogenase, partial [Verrucomicrobiota bacterium]